MPLIFLIIANHCVAFFPFKIDIVITDNGLEFTNRLIKSKKGLLCSRKSQFTNAVENSHAEHRCTMPAKPQTNGMVECVNHTIKSATIKTQQYSSNEEMNKDLIQFMTYYNLDRKHGRLQKETGCKTPYDAFNKAFQLKPNLFHQEPSTFKQKLLSLNQQIRQ